MSSITDLYNEAEQLKDKGDFEEAAAKLQTLLEQQESYTLAHLALAVIYGKLGRHEDAVRHGQRACELEPKDPFNFTAMSVTYQRASLGVSNAQDNQRYIQLAEQAMAQAHTLQSGG